MASPSVAHLIAARRAKPLVPLWDRFWAKVDTSAGEDACWPWTGARSYRKRRRKNRGKFAKHWGRGVIQQAGRGSRTLKAHRVALCFTGAGVEEEYDRPEQAAHKCGNRICCNPLHLYWASFNENWSDRYGASRHRDGAEQE